MDISVVIPVYNERHRLPDTLTTLVYYLKTQFDESEIIIVEDGSSETVEDIVTAFPESGKVKVRYLSHFPNRGKGYSVRRGVLKSEGRLIAFMDADGATPVHEMERLLDAVIKEGAEAAIGSRIPTAETTVEKSVHRFLIGRFFTFIVNRMTGLDFMDTQCGFKLFTREAALKLFGPLVTEGFAFDVELLYRAKRERMFVKEVNVNWHDVAGSKVRLGTDSIRMLIDVMKIVSTI